MIDELNLSSLTNCKNKPAKTFLWACLYFAIEIQKHIKAIISKSEKNESNTGPLCKLVAPKKVDRFKNQKLCW